MNIIVIISDYIRRELMNGVDSKVDEAENLFAAGIVDSLGIWRLVNFIEDHFGLETADEDVTLENFQSIKAIADYVEKQQ